MIAPASRSRSSPEARTAESIIRAFLPARLNIPKMGIGIPNMGKRHLADFSKELANRARIGQLAASAGASLRVAHPRSPPIEVGNHQKSIVHVWVLRKKEQ